MSPLEAILNRYRGGAAYMQTALGELESELLSQETSDKLAHRIHNILRNFQRLTEAPEVQVFIPPRDRGYIVILDPEGG
jgi:hypothetical protein